MCYMDKALTFGSAMLRFAQAMVCSGVSFAEAWVGPRGKGRVFSPRMQWMHKTEAVYSATNAADAPIKHGVFSHERSVCTAVKKANAVVFTASCRS